MKSVYTGGEKVAEFESYNELRVGGGKPAFIYEGNKLVYPNPVKDGLVLWYDFSGRTNADGQRGIAEDLSGNGNHGTLQNFNYTAESGYGKNKLLFDGVDDGIIIDNNAISNNFTTEGEISISFTSNSLSSANSQYILRSSKLNILKHFSVFDLNVSTTEGSRHHYSTRWEENKVVNWCVNAHKKFYSIYMNGFEVTRSEYTNSGVLNLEGESLIQEKISVNGYNGDIMSFFYYNRPLTPEEIAHNYAIEKERFGIE